jgi:hypothetical protein
MVDVPTALSPEPTQSPPPGTLRADRLRLHRRDGMARSSAAPTAPAPLADGPALPTTNPRTCWTERRRLGLQRVGMHLLDLPLGMNLIASDGALDHSDRGDARSRRAGIRRRCSNPVDPVDVLDPAPCHPMTVPHRDPSSCWPTPHPLHRRRARPGPRRAAHAARPRPRLRRSWSRPSGPRAGVEPGVRAGPGPAGAAGSGRLAGQATYAFGTASRRHAIPAAGFCSRMCRTGLPRRRVPPDRALSVESSGLVRVEGSPVYRLSVTLRNRAAWRWPRRHWTWR